MRIFLPANSRGGYGGFKEKGRNKYTGWFWLLCGFNVEINASLLVLWIVLKDGLTCSFHVSIYGSRAWVCSDLSRIMF